MSMFSSLEIISWAQRNFKELSLGDTRRVRRVIDIAQHLATFPGKSIPQLFDNVYAIKATYDLFKHKKATPKNLQKGHQDLVYSELENPGTYLLIEDTSELSWSGNIPVKGLGAIGAGAKGLQGFFLQSVLAIRWPQNNSVSKDIPIEILGLADQQFSTRSERKKLKRKTAIANTDKLESKVWERTIDRLPHPPENKEIRWVRVCDRGADIYEVLIKCLENNYGFVIRAAHDRIVDGENNQKLSLFTQARSFSALGSFSLTLRSRPNQPGRTVNLSVAAGHVKLKSPQRPGYKQGALPSIECSIVRVWENNSSEGVDPLEWILLCDQQIMNFEEALNCVNQYTCRWLIEDFHKALKTGLGAERLQLEEANRLFAAIAIMSIVALRLIDVRERFRIDPDAPAEKSGLSSLEIKILAVRLNRQLKTIRDVTLAIGRLGGHMNRKSDGMPGLITLWRGMQRLLELTDGAKLAEKLHIEKSFG